MAMATISKRMRGSSNQCIYEFVVIHTIDSCNDLRTALKALCDQKEQDDDSAVVVGGGGATTSTIMTKREELYLSLSFRTVDDDLLNEWIEGIDSIKSMVVKVTIDGEMFTSPVEAEKLDQFFQVLVSIPTLSDLQLSAASILGQVEQPLQAVAKMLHRARNIEDLVFQAFLFGGDEKDFADFASALQHHPSLTSIQFIACGITRENHTVSNVNLLLSALLTIPKLDFVSLPSGLFPPSRNASPDSLAPLLAVCHQVPALGFNSTEKILLPLGPLEKTVPFQVTYSSLRRNDGLRALGLWTALVEEDCHLLAGVIVHKPFLHRISLYIEPFKDDGHMKLIMQALADNHTLSRLDLILPSAPFFSSDVQDSLHGMIRDKNYSLKNINLTLIGTARKDEKTDQYNDTVAKLELYTKLNRQGRKTFLTGQDVSKEQRVQFLVDSSDDIDCLFYYISARPDLCLL